MKTVIYVIISIISIFPIVAAKAWEPPVGIPAPSWPDIGNPIESITPTPPPNWTSNMPGIYYVESGGTNTAQGYPGNPRGTIPQALPAGSIVFLNGTYTGDHRGSPIKASGVSSSPVWILSYNPQVRCVATKEWALLGSSYLIIDGINWDWRGYLYAKITLGSCSHVCIRNGLTIGNGTEEGTEADDFHNQSSVGIGPQSAQQIAGEHIVFHNVIFTKGGNWNYARLTNEDPDAHGMAVSLGVTDLWVLDCEFAYFSGCAFQAIASPSDADAKVAKRLYIGRCIAHHIAQSAFWVKRSQDVIFSQNTAHTIRRDCPSCPNSGGIGAQYGPRNLWIIYNTVHNCQSGVQINSNSLGTGATTTDIHIIGNLFYDIHDKDGSVDDWRRNMYSQGGSCISVWGGANTHIVNNTFDDYDVGIITPNTDYNRHVNGNIFTNRNGTVNGGELILDGDPRNANTFAHNLIQEINGACFVREIHGVPLSTVAAINAVKGPNNSNLVPNYIDVAERNYALKAASAGIDGFTSTAHTVYGVFSDAYNRSISFDHAGTPRPQNEMWDIGAFEFAPVTRIPKPNAPLRVVPVK